MRLWMVALGHGLAESVTEPPCFAARDGRRDLEDGL